MAFKILYILLAGLFSMPCNAEFRDPTQPAYPLPSTASADSATEVELVLSAIWISAQSRRAIINGVLGKQGETITVTPISTISPEPAKPARVNANKSDSLILDKALQTMTAETADPSLVNIAAPVISALVGGGNPALALLQSAMKTEKIESVRPTNKPAPAIAPGNTLPPKIEQPFKTVASPITIKIISIRKNTVVIDRNGERETLNLVQRPYKIN